MVYLGYRLFIQNSVEHKDNTASARAEGGGFKVTLTNFLPGTYFALFGTVIVGIMLWQGTPELIIKDLKEVTDDGKGRGKGRTMEFHMRSSEFDTDIDYQWNKISESGLTLSNMAQPLSKIARIWQQQGRTGEALAMSRLAVKGEQNNPAYLAMYAELLMDSNNTEKSLRVMQAAVNIESSYSEALVELQKQLGELDN